MIIKNRKIYPSYTSEFLWHSLDIVYDSCNFIGFNLDRIDKIWYSCLNGQNAVTFQGCYFDYCVFSEHTCDIFIDCVFNNCTFKGTFKAIVDWCDFNGTQPYVPMACPVEGDFIGWKIAYKELHIDLEVDPIMRQRIPCIIKLFIPAEAKRSSTCNRKCRCNKAIVLDVQTLDGKPVDRAYSAYDPHFIYEPNKVVMAPDFCENRWHECAPGIHFFMERQEAINYWG